VVTAEPLDGDDAAIAQRLGGGRDGIGSGHARVAGSVEREHGAAVRARDGLGVKASIARRRVLAPAVGAHREVGQRRALAIVGQRTNDAEARTALAARQ